MDPEGFEALLEEHCEWMKSRNYALKTLESRKKCIGYFTRWCMERAILRPRDVTRAILENYQRRLFYQRKKDGQPLSVSTQRSQLIYLRTWFKWLARYHHIDTNPAGELEMPRSFHRLPRHVLTAKEVEQVLSLTDTEDIFGLRDRAILEVLYSCGLRRMEMVNLKVWDVDFGREVVMVKEGKGKKDRYVPIGQRALWWLRKYITESRPRLACGLDAGALFLTQSGKGFSPEEMSQVARKYLRLAMPEKQGAAHLFRHTMATLMLDNGADIRYVQEMLGHSKLATTQVYTHVAISKLQEIHRATHPARLKGQGSAAGDEREQEA